jgi:acetoacetate decarboxylase
MKINKIFETSSMPLASPSYSGGPFRFINREYFIVHYETDPEAIDAALPEPLCPDGSNSILYEFIAMPDSSGFGSYVESGVVIPAKYEDVDLNFTAQMYLDNQPAIAGGREIWGFPKKTGKPSLATISDTLTGILEYAGIQVAIGTMAYKYVDMLCNAKGDRSSAEEKVIARLSKTQVNLKMIPDVDGKIKLAQLVSYQLTDIVIKGAWSGPARLHLVPHVNAPVADFPVRRVLGGFHIMADLTLPYGSVMHDYLK